MKTLKNILKIAVPVLGLSFGSLNANAQKDYCGCVKDIANNQIKIPYAKDGVTIQFFYSGKFMSQVVYNRWEDIIHDFPSSSKDSALIKFDWKKLAKFSEHQNWETIVKNVEGKIYIGNWFDTSRNHEANKIKITEINTSCYYPACSPNTYVFHIGVNLENEKFK